MVINGRHITAVPYSPLEDYEETPQRAQRVFLQKIPAAIKTELPAEQQEETTDYSTFLEKYLLAKKEPKDNSVKWLLCLIAFLLFLIFINTLKE